MSIHSMTGYASATGQASGWVVTVEARSVNHRGLDVRVDTPRECSWLEPR
ncbi:MAG: YicC/YloC family endoribonuclease, partial [Persicimonas sp.]